MTDSNFPTIKFLARSQDNGKTPGGGPTQPPKWVLKGDELIRKSKDLVSELQKLESSWKSKNIEGLPHVLKVDFIKKAMAKTHQQAIIPMFVVNDNSGQIGFMGDTSLIMKIGSLDQLKTIQNRFLNTSKNSLPISALTSIDFFSPKVEEVEDINKEFSYKLVPLNYDDAGLDALAIKIIEKNLSMHGIPYELISYNKNLPVFKLNNVVPDSLKFIRSLPIRYAEPMEEVNNPSNFFKQAHKKSSNNLVTYDKRMKNACPTVGLLDSGVSLNSMTEHWVNRGKGCQYSDNQLNTKHGTYIATLLIHGDSLSGTNDSSIKGCNIVDVPVVPKFAIDGPTLANNIKIAVEENKDVKIWNLSISLAREISTTEFSKFAMALDDIQKQFDVIICKSAGNDPDFCSKQEVGKLSVGAESIRSVTVGSLNRNSDKYKFCKKNFPAPYSRKGPGPAFTIKPDLTHFGGDLFAKKKNPLLSTDFQEISDTGSEDGVTLVHKVGTSFSTPKIAKNLAELDLLTAKKYSSLTLKSLEIQSGKYYETPALNSSQRLSTLGFGKPDNSYSVLYNSPYKSTLILEGELQKGRRIDIMDFPYPTALIKNNHFFGRITITLVSNPILIASQGAEYCQSNLDIKFGTYEKKKVPTKEINPLARDDSTNLLSENIYAKKKIKKNCDFLPERTLIKYGQKYHPVKKFAFDLSEVRDYYLNCLKSNRHWYLFLEGHYRAYIEKIALREKLKLSIPFSLVITIEDPLQKAPVYNSMIESLENNNFIYSPIKINNNVTIFNK